VQPDAVAVDGTRTTRKLLRALQVVLVVIAVAVATLTYAYFRVAHQLDVARKGTVGRDRTIASLSGAVSSLAGQSNENGVVLARIQDLAIAFAQLSSADAAVRDQARQKLAAIAAQPATPRRSSATSAPSSPTSTTRPPPPPPTTTQPRKPTCTTIPIARRCI
jgi:hypothetical protein